MKRTISVILLLCVLLSCAAISGFSAAAADGTADYGLPQNCKDGNILHCFDWTLSQIKQELPNIAEAGFTSVQTSPLQAHNGNAKWYWLYQPNGFTIGNELGSYDDLKALCAEADKYGIKIIVDVVANHVAGSNSGTWASSVESSLRKTEYFHNLGPKTNDNDRFEVTHKNIGMPDLNSEHIDVQNMVYAMLERYKAAGVDGIRWDAAKHISLPSEDCAFWSKMAQIDLFQYGEILNNPAGSSTSVNNALMTEYAQYIGVTDSVYSTDLFNAVKSGTSLKSQGNWNKYGVAADRIVYWGESHDTFANNANEGGFTKNVDQNIVDKVYAVLGSRAGSQALYFSRPPQKNKESITYGTKGSTHFTSKEIAAVNRFHNAMIGTEEKYIYNGGCYSVLRSRGAVLVSKSSDLDVSVNNSNSLVPAGTYIDEVTGNTFTVTDTKIKGHIGTTGIAVIYTDEPVVDPTESDVRLLGDADGSGEVDAIDVAVIMRFDAQIPVSIDVDSIMNGDVNNDKETDVIDATLIQRYILTMPTDYGIGMPIIG
ncbi:alpha-amylase family glycosyl hydrolase [uncultured Ruminococcus sp.]|uniref:alpha-amylase family glycosyl hydrolase n=1 Tax=uncultured Ruminococcus sp. TaxID=165186 RepID=UPI002930F9B9|nr:alpha-amylase family glycosyl hydrolase [uncultured Ruminococcus sp.]